MKQVVIPQKVSESVAYRLAQSQGIMCVVCLEYKDNKTIVKGI